MKTDIQKEYSYQLFIADILALFYSATMYNCIVYSNNH